MSGEKPFMTKNTLGLLTIDWNSSSAGPDPYEQTIKTPEMLALEQAAKDAIAKNKANKARREKLRSQSPTKKKAAEEDAKKKQAEDEARLRLEEEAAAATAAQLKAAKVAEEKAQEAEAARLRRREEEEAARRKMAEQEAAQKQQAEEEEARMFLVEAEEEAARRKAAEEAAQISVKKPGKAKRRISFFPCTPDNDGLVQAGRRYGTDVPFDWERTEWTMDFGTLKHATTRHNSYGWEKPEWATKCLLKKTTRGDAIKEGRSLERPILQRRRSFSDIRSEWALEWANYRLKSAERRVKRALHLGTDAQTAATFNSSMCDSFGESFAELLNSSQKDVAWEKPAWAKDTGLKSTEAGAAARQGVNLALPITNINDFLNKSLNRVADVAGTDTSTAEQHDRQEQEQQFGGSFMSLNNSIMNMVWEKPAWVANPRLNRTPRGAKMKENGSLAKPITFPKGNGN